MKLPFNKRYFQRAFWNFLLICACIIFGLFLINIDFFTGIFKNFIDLLTPFILGFVLAYLLNSPMKFFETKVFAFADKNKPRPRLRRVLAIVTTMITALLAITALVAIIIPQVTTSITTLVNSFNSYLDQFQKFIDNLLIKLNLDTTSVDDFFASSEQLVQTLMSKVQEFLPKLLDYVPNIFNFSKQLFSGVSDTIIGIVVSIYMLYSKERFFAQVKKILFALFPKKVVDRILDLTHSSHETFSGFISGKLLDSLIIGILCFVSLTILQIPYALLISVIVGITNIIPFFGPIIGAIPCALILLVVDPLKAVWFIIFIIILQQIDGNVIGPKILGDSTGLSAFWVMFAIVVGGGLFGIIGMFIGVPAFAVIYALVRTFIEQRLEKKGMDTSTEAYASEQHTLPETPKKEKRSDDQPSLFQRLFRKNKSSEKEFKDDSGENK